jgi:hypothetical protein
MASLFSCANFRLLVHLDGRYPAWHVQCTMYMPPYEYSTCPPSTPPTMRCGLTSPDQPAPQLGWPFPRMAWPCKITIPLPVIGLVPAFTRAWVQVLGTTLKSGSTVQAPFEQPWRRRDRLPPPDLHSCVEAMGSLEGSTPTAFSCIRRPSRGEDRHHGNDVAMSRYGATVMSMMVPCLSAPPGYAPSILEHPQLSVTKRNHCLKRSTATVPSGARGVDCASVSSPDRATPESTSSRPAAHNYHRTLHHLDDPAGLLTKTTPADPEMPVTSIWAGSPL